MINPPWEKLFSAPRLLQVLIHPARLFILLPICAIRVISDFELQNAQVKENAFAPSRSLIRNVIHKSTLFMLPLNSNFQRFLQSFA